MKTKLVHLNDDNERFFSFAHYMQSDSTNSSRKLQMKQLTEAVLSTELTPLQRFCVVQYYLNGKKQKEIAEQLGVSCSTVSRHIGAGMKKLKRAASLHLTLTEKPSPKRLPQQRPAL